MCVNCLLKWIVNHSWPCQNVATNIANISKLCWSVFSIPLETSVSQHPLPTFRGDICSPRGRRSCNPLPNAARCRHQAFGNRRDGAHPGCTGPTCCLGQKEKWTYLNQQKHDSYRFVHLSVVRVFSQMQVYILQFCDICRSSAVSPFPLPISLNANEVTQVVDLSWIMLDL